jgi:hypothetical protein
VGISLQLSLEDKETGKSSVNRMANAELVKKYSHPATIVIEQSTAGQQMAIDVYGQQINLICNYRTCNHKFSVHGHNNRACKCRHPPNYAAGVSLKRGYHIRLEIYM